MKMETKDDGCVLEGPHEGRMAHEARSLLQELEETMVRSERFGLSFFSSFRLLSSLLVDYNVLHETDKKLFYFATPTVSNERRKRVCSFVTHMYLL